METHPLFVITLTPCARYAKTRVTRYKIPRMHRNASAYLDFSERSVQKMLLALSGLMIARLE